jgi:outer membrane immunogenic protein
MKRVVLLSALMIASAAPAVAADLPRKAPPAPLPPPFVDNWTGFYIGINGGYSWGRSETTVDFFAVPSGIPIVPPAGSITGSTFDMEGGIFGGQIGYNWLLGPTWVLGFEADAQWSGQKGSAAFLCSATPLIGGVCVPGVTAIPLGFTGTGVVVDRDLEWFGTFRGRAGFLVTPSVLAYVTGGLAYGELSTSAAAAAITPAGLVVTNRFASSTTRVGWTIGGGLEWAGIFSPNWSAKLEYLYMDLGTQDATVTVVPSPGPLGIGANVSSNFTDHIFRAGINYRFSAGPGPLVARY